MSQRTDWSANTLNLFEKSSKATGEGFFNPSFNVTAKSFIPSATSSQAQQQQQSKLFDPFDKEDEDDINELGQQFISSTLLNDEEDDSPMLSPSSKLRQQANDEVQWTSSGNIKDIWEAPKAAQHQLHRDRSEVYSRGDEQEFDPTLQFYHGSLYDSSTIQDLNKLSLELPSVEEATKENVEEDMSTLQMMQTIFSDVSDAELINTLEKFDYDVDRAIESLLTQKMSIKAAEETAEASPGVAANTTSLPSKSDTTTTLEYTPKKRQVCRHFLAGECYRKDCWFVHDLQEKICKFWLQGSCLKGDSCEFSHHIDIQEVANKMTLPEPSKQKEPMNYNQGDYPALSSTRSKKTPAWNTSPSNVKEQEQDEFPTLASAAKIKKSPMIKGRVINFAEAAKKKKTAPSPKPASAKKSLLHRPHKYSHQKLTQPVHIPWLETGSSLNTIYMKEREQAIEYGMLRNRLFSKATEYYLKGDGARAKLYSMEAKEYNRLMQEMHFEASQRIFESRSKHEAFIDLHGLHEDEAMDIVDERLAHLKATYSGIIYIVTGTGHHSGASGFSKKQSKLKPTVYNYLKQGHYHFAETSIVGDDQGGVFAVEI
ncbi:hypothetical protein BD408DRAFT_383708 [Parasitella parasitica]|nr:hypothetical protein BD408DRAFT_383708 [Parasitella parasitica]